jgi:hypothetical protein
MPIKLISGAGGSLTVTPASTASNYTLTVPAVTANVVTTGDSNTITQTMINQSSFFAGYGPAFYAYNSSATSLINGAGTKIAFQTKLFDTANCFDNTTNYRFQPNVAGYYQLSGSVRVDTSCAYIGCYIWKNGSNYSGGNFTNLTTTNAQSVISSLMYLNGTTDYAELAAFITTTSNTTTGQLGTYFTGFLARAT